VHGKWRDVLAGAAVVARCAVSDYRMCKALLTAPVIIGSSPDNGAYAADLVCGNLGKWSYAWCRRAFPAFVIMT